MELYLLITFGLCLAYLGLYFSLGPFFGLPQARLASRSWLSFVIIILLHLAMFWVISYVDDLALQNRLMHGLGGGFIAVIVCLLAVRDSGVGVNRFQFFVIGALVATALGVANEIMEFFLQYYFAEYDFYFAVTINDTWLDLISNTIGILLANALFLPFVKKSQI